MTSADKKAFVAGTNESGTEFEGQGVLMLGKENDEFLLKVGPGKYQQFFRPGIHDTKIEVRQQSQSASRRLQAMRLEPRQQTQRTTSICQHVVAKVWRVGRRGLPSHIRIRAVLFDYGLGCTWRVLIGNAGFTPLWLVHHEDKMMTVFCALVVMVITLLW